MTPIRGFSSLTSPVVNYKDIFPSEVEFSQPIEIQVARIDQKVGVDFRTKKFIYNFIKKEDNKSFLKIEIKAKTNDGFELSVLEKEKSNEIKKFVIQDPKIAEFRDNCKTLSCHHNSFLMTGYTLVPFALIELGLLCWTVYAGATCLEAKSMTEFLKSCIIPAVVFAVFVAGIGFFYTGEKAADKVNTENRIALQRTILNKHLAVIQAYNQNNTQVTSDQLLTFAKV